MYLQVPIPQARKIYKSISTLEFASLTASFHATIGENAKKMSSNNYLHSIGMESSENMHDCAGQHKKSTGYIPVSHMFSF